MISIVVISKDEPTLEYTLAALGIIKANRDDVEVVVVDASQGRLNYLRNDAAVTWIEYEQPSSVGVTIAHQRNLGVGKAQGEIIVFTDAGCEPQEGWLDALTAPIIGGVERVVTGIALSRSGESTYDSAQLALQDGYVEECATINLAFERSAFDQVGGFDETFDYGSDVDFSWRLRDLGVPIFRNTAAVIAHDWGSRKRQAKRAFAYGRARTRLYRKHRSRWRTLVKNDPIAVAYPLFLLGLPLMLRVRAYPLLLVVPLVKNRNEQPVRVVADHLAYGAGVLRELTTP